MTRFRRTRSAGEDDAGIALLIVIGSMLVLAMLALTALAFTVSSQKFARYDQDYSSTMSAAQSGIDDYISRLNRDDGYFQAVDCTNVALRGPSVPGNICGWGAGTAVGWLPVSPGETGDKDAFFHYSVDSTRALTEGTITVRSTGRVNGEYRTVEAAVGKGGSTDYVYYTDFESADPSNVQSYTASKIASLTTTQKAACGLGGYDAALYWWEGREGKSCNEIQFAPGDVLEGSVFTNDSALANGPTFTDGFMSANPECKNVTASTSTWKWCLRKTGGTYSTANFNNVRPQYSTALYLDDTSAAFTSYPGCHYYGSTRIIFEAAGTMRVWNKVVNGGGVPTAIAPPGGTQPSCGSTTELNSAAGASVAVPDNMVIQVSPENSGVTHARCDAGQIGGPGTSTLPLGTYTKAMAAAKPPLGSSTYTFDLTMKEATKYCQEGNLYVQGTVKGRVTLAASQSVVLTGDIMLAGGLSGADMVGLVATNSVEVFHPWMTRVSALGGTACPGGSACKWDNEPGTEIGAVAGWPVDITPPAGMTAFTGIEIMGSIQTLQHSFYVQRYDKGTGEGQLRVDGSIAQRWRGIVGTGNGDTGYLKKYVYDTRLKYSAPPYFPRWVNAQWSQRYFGESNTPPELKS
ncbi:hypothetical protein [Cellulomonas sp. Root137]|uniref:hypothetical protein n=1 Tax=Cellulomonas sp. Root137 TaxID=1736459 RepID=UPI0006F6A88D|nr:hypothetical protein [Cellulomonas sp. Root137]KQY44075.1 hypothetical protein ASD18_17220 [Cellulomonas sp. Root137]